MSGALRRGDALFRLGGDEFAALLAVERGEQALGAGRAPARRRRSRRASASRSRSASPSRSAGETDDALLARADRALYRSRRPGATASRWPTTSRCRRRPRWAER